jgi:hypothetical protein
VGTFPGVAEAPDLDLLAASLRADTSDTAVFLEALATKLEDAFPGQVAVERKGRLFGGPKRVRRIEVRVGDTHYEIEGDGGVVSARRRSVVRGIALKSEDLAVEAWIDGLSGDLLVLAERSEQGRVALQRLLTD